MPWKQRLKHRRNHERKKPLAKALVVSILLGLVTVYHKLPTTTVPIPHIPFLFTSSFPHCLRPDACLSPWYQHARVCHQIVYLYYMYVGHAASHWCVISHHRFNSSSAPGNESSSFSTIWNLHRIKVFVAAIIVTTENQFVLCCVAMVPRQTDVTHPIVSGHATSGPVQSIEKWLTTLSSWKAPWYSTEEQLTVLSAWYFSSMIPNARSTT